MTPRLITYDAIAEHLSWIEAVEALKSGHRLAKAAVADLLLGPPSGTLLTRGAYIEGLGYGIKSVSVFDANAAQGLPTIQGAMLVFDPRNGHLDAIIDAILVTEFKTAADSALGASFLARPDSRHLLIVGAGTVARSLVHAYLALFPGLERISIWARREEASVALANEFEDGNATVTAVPELAAVAAEADIISSATMAREPVLRGEWIRPGTHVDLIGAYKADMREADDALISHGSLFVDSRETTIEHIGELTIPIAGGVITADSVLGDFYDLVPGRTGGRHSEDEITVFKNGGGAHLDLMIARYIAEKFESSATSTLSSC